MEDCGGFRGCRQKKTRRTGGVGGGVYVRRGGFLRRRRVVMRIPSVRGVRLRGQQRSVRGESGR